jgi:hypothetical protein
MLNTTNITSGFSLAKDLVSDQTYLNLSKKVNESNIAFDVTEGLGLAASTTSVVLINAGGFSDQYIQAEMKYVSPTTAGNEDFGVFLRVVTMESSTPGENYYYANIVGGFARITKVLDGSVSTLTQSAFALTQDDLVTITFQVIGSALSATFESSGSPTTVEINTTDSDISQSGLLGFGSTSSSFYCRSFTVQEV